MPSQNRGIAEPGYTLGAAQEDRVLSLGSILALIPADYPGLGVSEITGYGFIPLLEFPRLLSLYLSDNQDLTANSPTPPGDPCHTSVFH